MLPFFTLCSSSLVEGEKPAQCKCSYFVTSKEISEIFPAGNEKMFGFVEHRPGQIAESRTLNSSEELGLEKCLSDGKQILIAKL